MFYPEPLSGQKSTLEKKSDDSKHDSEFETIIEPSPEKPRIFQKKTSRKGTPLSKATKKPLKNRKIEVEILRDAGEARLKSDKFDLSLQDPFLKEQNVQTDAIRSSRKPRKKLNILQPLKLNKDNGTKNSRKKSFISSSPIDEVNKTFEDPFPSDLSLIQKPIGDIASQTTNSPLFTPESKNMKDLKGKELPKSHGKAKAIKDLKQKKDGKNNAKRSKNELRESPVEFARKLLAKTPGFATKANSPPKKSGLIASDEDLEPQCPLFSDPMDTKKRKLTRYKAVVNVNEDVNNDTPSEDSGSAFFSFNKKKLKKGSKSKKISFDDNTNPLLMKQSPNSSSYSLGEEEAEYIAIPKKKKKKKSV